MRWSVNSWKIFPRTCNCACTLKNPRCGGWKISLGRLLLNILLGQHWAFPLVPEYSGDSLYMIGRWDRTHFLRSSKPVLSCPVDRGYLDTKYKQRSFPLEKLQFWEWKSLLLVREHLVPRLSCILQSAMPEDIYGIEEYKMPAWARDKMFPHQQGTFSKSNTATFHMRASFWLAYVTVREYVKNRLSNKRRRYFQLNPDHSVKLCERRKDEPVWSKAVMIRKTQPINSLMMWIVYCATFLFIHTVGEVTYTSGAFESV